LEVDFEKWLRSYDISLSFQNIRKNQWGSWSRNHKIYRQILLKAAELVQYFLDIVLERDVRNQEKKIFLNFGIKCREI
jgi:endonuclease/exonuclease/phosphatase (EEP) superfamily protein YafD